MPFVGLLVMLCAATPPDEGGVHRYALLIGANVGNASEQHLQYAVRDATEMQHVLTQLGNFASNDVVVLADPSADAVRARFAELHNRMADDHNGSVLFVYYSGHADALNLHLDGTAMPWDELLKLTNRSGATTRLLVVDACRSGQATRVKGSHLVTPFSIAEVGPDLPSGFAVLASASADETAQESDEIGGSIFTHHFLAALRGAADSNLDGRVSLTEAFEYSADRTVASSADSLAGVQHATFRYRLRGRGDLSLTEPAFSKNLAPLRLSAPGEYYMRYENANGVLATEAVVHDEHHAVWLPPGRYFIQRRTSARLYEGSVDLRVGKIQTIRDAAMQPVEFTQLANKGAEVTTQVSPAEEPLKLTPPPSMGVWGGTGMPLLPHFAPPWTVMYQAAIPLNDLFVLDLGGQYGDTSATSNNLTTALMDAGAFAGARAVAALGIVELSGGLRVGALYINEHYSGSESLPDRWHVTPFAMGVARLDVHLPEGFFLSTEGGLRVVPVSLLGQSNSIAWQPLISLGIGHTL